MQRGVRWRHPPADAHCCDDALWWLGVPAAGHGCGLDCIVSQFVTQQRRSGREQRFESFALVGGLRKIILMLTPLLGDDWPSGKGTGIDRWRRRPATRSRAPSTALWATGAGHIGLIRGSVMHGEIQMAGLQDIWAAVRGSHRC